MNARPTHGQLTNAQATNGHAANIQTSDETHWLALSGVLRQVLARGPFTLAEAQAAFEAVVAPELSSAEVEMLIARATRVAGTNGTSAKRNGAALSTNSVSSRKLLHEPLERRDLLTPLFDWFCGSNSAATAALPPAPSFPTACYAAAW